MADVDNPKYENKAQKLMSISVPVSSEKRENLEEISRHIEVLLHASEAPLTAGALKKHLSVSTKELTDALGLLQERLDTGVLKLHETASGYRLPQIADNYSTLYTARFPQRQERLSKPCFETLSVIALQAASDTQRYRAHVRVTFIQQYIKATI